MSICVTYACILIVFCKCKEAHTQSETRHHAAYALDYEKQIQEFRQVSQRTR